METIQIFFYCATFFLYINIIHAAVEPRSDLDKFFLNLFKNGATIQNNQKKGEIIHLTELLGFGSDTLIFGLQDHKDRAIKVILIDYVDAGVTQSFENDETFLEIINREKRSAEHQGCVQMFDRIKGTIKAHAAIPFEQQCLAFTMTRIESLDKIISRTPNYLEDQNMLVLLHNLLSALEYIQSLGIQHNDIFPNNIGIIGQFLNQVALFDFGLASKTNATIKDVTELIYIVKGDPNEIIKENYPLGHKGTASKNAKDANRRYPVDDAIQGIYSILMLYGSPNVHNTEVVSLPWATEDINGKWLSHDQNLINEAKSETNILHEAWPDVVDYLTIVGKLHEESIMAQTLRSILNDLLQLPPTAKVGYEKYKNECKKHIDSKHKSMLQQIQIEKKK